MFIGLLWGYSIQPVSTTHDDHHDTTTFTFDRELPKDSAVLRILYDGILSDKMAGFYRSSYKDAEGNTKYMGVTQFEATDARRAFPCWDEPAIKATYSISLVIPSELVALSNMPVASMSQVDPAVLTVNFEKTPIMSTYVCCWIMAQYPVHGDMTDITQCMLTLMYSHIACCLGCRRVRVH